MLRLPNMPALRVVKGTKKPGDLVLEWFSSKRKAWVPVEMSAAAIITDFLYENEEHLYPTTRGFMGGKYFLEYLRIAAEEGWEVANQKLATEKHFKRTG